MRGAVALALVLALTAGSGCSFNMYERGMVRRIDVTKKAEPPVLEAQAFWLGELGVKLKVAQKSKVSLERTVKYNTIEWIAEYVWYFEIVEFIFFPILLPLYAALVYAGVVLPEGDNMHVPDDTKLKLATGVINPAVSLMYVDIVRTENTDVEVFADKPIKISYPMRLPAGGLEISYRFLDEAGAEVAAGTASTDVFGEAFVTGLEAKPAKVELKGAGLEQTLAL